MQRLCELDYVTLNSHDAAAGARFWAGVLGTDIALREGPYVVLRPGSRRGPALTFQTTPRESVGVVHLDVRVSDLDEATSLVDSLGGTLQRDVVTPTERYRLMHDPDGHVFCLLEGPRPSAVFGGPPRPAA